MRIPDRRTIEATRYDYVVVGASVAGLVFASKKAEAGAAVLTLNEAPFGGGAISEANAALQRTDVAEPKTRAIYEAIERERHGVFAKRDERAAINAEAMKSVAQDAMEGADYDVLFAERVSKISFNGSALLSLDGPEGPATIEAEKVFDASETYAGTKAAGGRRAIETSLNNIIIEGAADRLADFRLTAEHFPLDDRLTLMSLVLDARDEREIENRANEALATLQRFVVERGGRVYAAPSRSQVVYRLDAPPQEDRVLAASRLAGVPYERDNAFIVADAVERNAEAF
jgi:hypothetical protein